MKKIIPAFIAAVLVLAAVSAFGQENAVVRQVTGKVEMQAASGAWRPVKEGDRIPLGAVISTSFRSEAVLDIGTASVVVKQLTRIRLDELARRDDVLETKLHLRVGRVRAEIKSEEGLRNDFQLRSPVSTAAVRGTEFDFDGVNLKVLAGFMALANAYNQTTQVAAGEITSTDGFTVPPAGVEALEKLFNVSISASQLEEMLSTFQPPPNLTPGSVTLNWYRPW